MTRYTDPFPHDRSYVFISKRHADSCQEWCERRGEKTVYKRIGNHHIVYVVPDAKP